MGWSSATEIFDTVCQEVLKPKPLDKKKLLVALIRVLEDKDWDCQCESEYLDNPLVKEAFLETGNGALYETE